MAPPRSSAPRPRQQLTARPGGATSILTAEEATANARAIDATIKALGGKEGLLDVLAVASDVPEVDELLRLIVDPRYKDVSLRQLCTHAGLTVVDLFTAYRKAIVVKTQLLSYQIVSQRIEAVVLDVMQRAAPFKIPCYACGATGETTDPEAPTGPKIVCAQCAGHKELLQLPDLDRQKLALELAQLVQKGGGINIQQNQLTVPPADPEPDQPTGGLLELQRAVHELLSGPRQPIIDATVIPADPLPIPAEVP
jgi:hypothetical protein